MRKTKQMKVIMILFGIVVLISFLISNKLVIEGLKNFENPITHYGSFHSKIKNNKDADYGSIVEKGRPNYQDFVDTDKYDPIEVEQDIKYFNNATNLIMGLEIIENGLKV
jgi:hypothetical protein